MEITRIRSELLSSNMYILAEGGHAVVIDPCCDLSPLREGVIYDRILLTHEHYDHISGVNLWKEKTGAEVFCTDACAEALPDPVKNMSRYFRMFCELQTFIEVENPADVPDYSCRADAVFSDSAVWQWQGHTFEMLACRGHSAGSMLILTDRRLLFSGDTVLGIFPPEHRMAGKERRVRRVADVPLITSLAGSLTVYPGHFDSFAL